MFYIKKAGIEEFIEIYNKYLLVQFPQAELKKLEDFIKLLSDEKCGYRFYVAKNDDITVGYTLFYEGCDFIWIDYIAVLPQFYSGGFGRKIIKSFENTFNIVKGLYFEVEKPDEADINTIRRIKFYNSCGAEKLDCNYFYPTADGALAMDLYFLPVNKDTALTKKDLLKDISEVFGKLHFMCPKTSEILEKIS